MNICGKYRSDYPGEVDMSKSAAAIEITAFDTTSNAPIIYCHYQLDEKLVNF